MLRFLSLYKGSFLSVFKVNLPSYNQNVFWTQLSLDCKVFPRWIMFSKQPLARLHLWCVIIRNQPLHKSLVQAPHWSPLHEHLSHDLFIYPHLCGILAVLESFFKWNPWSSRILESLNSWNPWSHGIQVILESMIYLKETLISYGIHDLSDSLIYVGHNLANPGPCSNTQRPRLITCKSMLIICGTS